MKRFWSVLAIGALALATLAFVALGNVIGPGGPPGGPPRVILPPEPPQRVPDALDALLQDVDLGPPQSYRGLTIYPLRHRHLSTDFRPLTFDEALAKGVLDVREVDRGVVDSVEVNNRSDRYAFLMGGQILSGARQDRMFRQDTILPPFSGWTRVGVYCVEKGRWTPVATGFGSKGQVVNPALRQAAGASAPQETIWAGVDRKARELSVRQLESRAFGHIYADDRVQQDLADYERNLEMLPLREMCGAVAVSGGGILGADLFFSEGLFEELWPKLLRSYALDAKRSGLGPVGERDRVLQFLRGALSDQARRQPLPTPGAGELVSLTGSPTGGTALLFRDETVHAHLFPAVTILPRPLLERR